MVDERLNKVLKEFNRMLGKLEEDEDILDKLIHLGLTLSEAKGWLRKEPNYKKLLFRSSDDSYHEPSNRRKVNRTHARKTYNLPYETRSMSLYSWP
jgi:hypothetical protein